MKVVVLNPTPLGPMLIVCPLYKSLAGFAPSPNVNVFPPIATIEEPLVHEASGSTNYPTEVAADTTHERFELPATLGPAELDSDSGTWEGTTANGTADSTGFFSYERARRKIERQQTAAMMELQTAPVQEIHPVEKSEISSD
jgi:hypothetical protein